MAHLIMGQSNYMENERLRNEKPVRYFISNDFLDFIQDVVNYPRDKIKDFHYYWKNVFLRKSHVLSSKSLNVGEYHDFDTRILYCVFDSLVDFVEVEKAHMEQVFGDSKNTGRSKEDGLKYLEWEATLDGGDCEQARNAKTIIELYHWWIAHKFFLENLNFQEIINEEERIYEKEQEMLEKLISIRKSLWT